MQESEELLGSTQAQKDRIRARYRGVNPDEIEVIPAVKQESFYEDKSEKRVAVYARVSTDDPRQTSSYELQKNHYTDVVSRREGWKLVGIYADEGISGTSLQHRDEFIRMIADCKAHKIDIIITKSVSRFARNVLDCIGYVRELAAMRPPVGVFFETENIYTLNPNSELSLSIISTLAQEESHNKSEIMNASIEMRFRRGVFLTPALLGYDKDPDEGLVINEEEAKTVRLIFFMYLYGYTCTQIAETLTKLRRKTKKGNTTWSPGTILNVLQNERHCGDILARKTWTPNYLDHKSRKNVNARNQYIRRDNHTGIISRDDFLAVQRLISNAKYGNRGILPELQVIDSGALKGFVSINPRWGAFKSADYIAASESVNDGVIDITEEREYTVEVQSGDFDLRGFEIARSQFFSGFPRCCIKLSKGKMSFSRDCIEKLGNCTGIEVLVHPVKKIIAVRAAKKETKNAIQWAVAADNKLKPKQISGCAFIDTLFEMFDWNFDCRYQVRGAKKNNGVEVALFFDMNETEVFFPNKMPQAEGSTEPTETISTKQQLESGITPLAKTKRALCAYPAEWSKSFGREYYRHAQIREMAHFASSGDWQLSMSGVPFSNEEKLKSTPPEQLKVYIEEIIDGITDKEESEFEQ